LRLALWPDEGEQTHRTAVERFFARPRTLGSMPRMRLRAMPWARRPIARWASRKSSCSAASGRIRPTRKVGRRPFIPRWSSPFLLPAQAGYPAGRQRRRG